VASLLRGRRLHPAGRRLHAAGRRLHAAGRRLHAAGGGCTLRGGGLHAVGRRLNAAGRVLRGGELAARGGAALCGARLLRWSALTALPCCRAREVAARAGRLRGEVAAGRGLLVAARVARVVCGAWSWRGWGVAWAGASRGAWAGGGGLNVGCVTGSVAWAGDPSRGPRVGCVARGGWASRGRRGCTWAGGGQARHAATPFATGERLLLAVAQAPPRAGPPHLLTLYAPDLGWGAHVGEAVGVELAQGPFNLCLLELLPKSIGCRRLGFPNAVVQWGVDGTLLVHGGRLRVAPFVAPHVHAMDHPDYVLVYLETGKPGTALLHRAGGRVTTPFAKIILYPLFREERMVPRETTLTSGESLSQVVLRFENPDGPPQVGAPGRPGVRAPAAAQLCAALCTRRVASRGLVHPPRSFAWPCAPAA